MHLSSVMRIYRLMLINHDKKNLVLVVKYNGLCLNNPCGGHYQILILLHCRLDRMSKQTTMVHQVFGGYYRSQGENHRIYSLQLSTVVKMDSVRLVNLGEVSS